MPGSPTSALPRRRASLQGVRATVALAALSLVLLASCTGQKDPTSYGSGVHKNFVNGCVAGYAPSGNPASDPQAKQHRTTCECLYSKMTQPKEKGGIPFKDFASAQSKIRDNPGKYKIADVLPHYSDYVRQCASAPAGPEAPTTSVAKVTTTSAAPTS